MWLTIQIANLMPFSGTLLYIFCMTISALLQKANLTDLERIKTNSCYQLTNAFFLLNLTSFPIETGQATSR